MELVTVWSGATWREFPQPVVGTVTRGTVRIAPSDPPLSARQQTILTLLDAHGSMTLRNLGAALNVSRKTVREAVAGLVERELILAEKAHQVDWRGGWGWVYRRAR